MANYDTVCQLNFSSHNELHCSVVVIKILL